MLRLLTATTVSRTTSNALSHTRCFATASDASGSRASEGKPKVPGPRPLDGVRVIELGNFVAGPYCSTLLAYYGADVIKVEPPGAGDQVRQFRSQDPNGTGWWWHSIGRNKRSIVLDLKTEGAQQVVRDLCGGADVLVENFRPGKLEEWHLSPKELHELNDQLVVTRVSGYGQTGPYAKRPGFASACEAMGGFRYVNGFPDGPSVRPNLSIGDTLAGMHAAFGTVLALLARDKVGGQTVDASIYESVFSLMEGVLCDYDGQGQVRQPSGSTVTGIVPTGTYPTKDGKSVVIGANSDTLFKRLMVEMGQHGMADSPMYVGNQNRVMHQTMLDELIKSWTLQQDADDVVSKLSTASVPVGLIYSIEDIVKDPQYQAREMIEEVHIPTLGRSLKIPGITPKLDKTPGATTWPGPELGEHTRQVLEDVLKYDSKHIKKLEDDGVVVL